MKGRGFEAFLRKYQITNPAPRTNWQFWILAVPLVAVMLVVSMRTGFQFYITAVLTAERFLGEVKAQELTAGFSMFEVTLTILGIEGLIVAFGLLQGYRTGQAACRQSERQRAAWAAACASQ